MPKQVTTYCMKSVSPVLHNSPSIYIPVQKMQGHSLPSVNIGDNCLASSLLGFLSHHHVDTAMFFLSTVSRRPVVAGSLVPRPHFWKRSQTLLSCRDDLWLGRVRCRLYNWRHRTVGKSATSVWVFSVYRTRLMSNETVSHLVQYFFLEWSDKLSSCR